MAVSPEWINLPKRRCDDCGKSYKPTRPRRILNGKQEYGFCSDNCRKSFHKHGAAYRKLRVEVQRMVAREFDRINAELKELRAVWIETESRYVELKVRLDEITRGVTISPKGAKQNGERVHRANG